MHLQWASISMQNQIWARIWKLRRHFSQFGAVCCEICWLGWRLCKSTVRKMNLNWAATNGGVTNGGLRGVWPPFLEIGRNRPFFCLFRPFRRVRRAPGKWGYLRKKAFFLRYPQICLNPHLLNPHLRHSYWMLDISWDMPKKAQFQGFLLQFLPWLDQYSARQLSAAPKIAIAEKSLRFQIAKYKVTSSSAEIAENRKI